MSKFPLKDFYHRIHSRYDLVNSIFTFGLDTKWRRIAAKSINESHPEKILDLCCGTGKFTFAIDKYATQYPLIKGYDFSEDMLKHAKATAKKQKNENIEFIQGDVASMPFEDNSFDAIGISFGFRNLTFNSHHENIHISEMHRVLKDGGNLYILESGSPQNLFIQFFYTLFLFVFLVPIGGILTGDFKAYYYLAISSRSYYSRQQMMLLLKSFGFKNVKVRKFLFGATNLTKAEK